MSVLDFAVGDQFVVRVLKHLVTNPENVWANSYEFEAITASSEINIHDLADAIGSFEIGIHLNIVQFDRVIISTWEADSKPYDPAAFLVLPLNALGTHPIGADQAVPLNECWRVVRQPAAGRVGHLFYRGCLVEGDVESPAGKPILSTPPDFAELLGDQIESSLLESYFGDTATGGLKMVMIDATGGITRNVIQLVSSGVSFVKPDHVLFNRTPAEPSLLAKSKVTKK